MSYRVELLAKKTYDKNSGYLKIGKNDFVFYLN